MHCYNHHESEFLVICKSCLKAVCVTCAIDTGTGLACCALCEKDITKMSLIVEKTKSVYRIGKYTGSPRKAGLLYLIVTVFFFYNGFSVEIRFGNAEPVSILLGCLFIAYFVDTVIRSKTSKV